MVSSKFTQGDFCSQVIPKSRDLKGAKKIPAFLVFPIFHFIL